LFGAIFEAFGFVSKKSERADNSFEFFDWTGSVMFEGWKISKEFWGNLVYFFVGALSRQDDDKKQGPGMCLVMGEVAFFFGVSGLYLAYEGFWVHYEF